MLRFFCGGKKVCSSIKMSQNIMNMVVATGHQHHGYFDISTLGTRNFLNILCNFNTRSSS